MLEHWLWLARRTAVKGQLKAMLLEQFGSPEAIFAAKDYSGISSLTTEGRDMLLDKSLDAARKILFDCEDKKIGILTMADEEYPDRLRNIYDPPVVLYYIGRIPRFDSLPAIGVVGTRSATAYGLTMAHRLGAEITACGGLVVSGLAGGIDAVAMEGALSAGGSTVGVLGCGVDLVYPAANRALYAATEENGCILSEYAPGEKALRWHFPMRNRIISGLSCGVLVVEAPEKSGALQTAGFALEQGREVFAVPGNVGVPSCAGSNRLLREGAGTVTCGWDVMSEFAASYPEIHRAMPSARSGGIPVQQLPKPAGTTRSGAKEAVREEIAHKKDIDNDASAPYIDLKTILQGLSADEQAVVQVLSRGERTVDDLIVQTGIAPAKVLSILTLLEIRRIVARLPGRRVALQR